MISKEQRLELLERLGQYMQANDEAWQEAKKRAVLVNAWFTEESVAIAEQNILQEMLQPGKLRPWLASYTLPAAAKKVGIVMAGNIPLVGFHDFLCGFVSGHRLYLKLSSKDEVLLRHLVGMLTEWEPAVAQQVIFSDLLKDCDAYIATGSNNSARYFEQYFARFPHVIRRNRTSVALLDGTETDEELQLLADDVFLYYGLGCRNVTQLWVPEGYNFDRLLAVFGKYDALMLQHKYKNNYDYHLALYLLNRVPYLTNDSVLLVENALPFSAVSVLHYRFYKDKAELTGNEALRNDIQCIVGHGQVPFGQSQSPGLGEYADGVDTMAFLCSL